MEGWLVVEVASRVAVVVMDVGESWRGCGHRGVASYTLLFFPFFFLSQPFLNQIFF